MKQASHSPGRLGARLRRRLGDRTFREFWQDWKWIFRYGARYRGALTLYTVLGIASATLSLSAAVTSKYLIDVVQSRDAARLGLLAAILLGSAAVSLLLTSAVSRLSARISVQVNNDMQADVYARVLDADWSHISRYANGDLLNRIQNDVGTVSANAVNWLPKLCISCYSFLATLAVLLYYDWIMALIALMSAPFLFLTGRYLMKRLRQLRQQVLETNSGMMAFESETLYQFDTIKSFGAARHYCQQLSLWHRRYAETNLEYNSFSIRANIGLSILAAAVSYVAFGYCLLRLWSGGITFGTMTLFLQQRSRLTSSFDSLVGAVPGMLNGAVSARRLRELMDLPAEPQDERAEQAARALARDGVHVAVDGVTAGYAGQPPVLHDCSLQASPGEMVAVVGASGGGKTTLLRLLLGLLQPQKGQVLLSGPAGSFAMCAGLRPLFSYVPQGNTLLRGTIAENLRMARPEATDAQLIEALQAACAWDFVRELDGTLQAQVGERGKGLSEGQAQRIAIARAVLRDAPVLLLDEATSALDEQTEAQVLRGILAHGSGKTCIVTSHRPSVLRLCSRVYRLEGGVLRTAEQEAL